MKKLLYVGLLASVTLLTSCASQQDYLNSLQAYNGLPERALIEKFGVPDRTYEVDGRKYLSFVTKRTNYYPAQTGVYGSNVYDRRVFSTGVSSSTYQVTECENTFVIYKGVVENSGYKGVCY